MWIVERRKRRRRKKNKIMTTHLYFFPITFFLLVESPGSSIYRHYMYVCTQRKRILLATFSSWITANSKAPSQPQWIQMTAFLPSFPIPPTKKERNLYVYLYKAPPHKYANVRSLHFFLLLLLLLRQNTISSTLYEYVHIQITEINFN